MRTKRVQTILWVLEHARSNRLPLPAAVEAYRSELRASMRRHRDAAREARGVQRHTAAEMRIKMVARLRRESARVRRLQLEFTSWRDVA